MSKSYRVGVVGATGLVGQTFLNILTERDFPVEKLHALASHRSAGKTVRFKDQPIRVEDIATFDFSQIDIALFSAGKEVARDYAPTFAKQGIYVIDNSSQFRYNDAIPLIIPEVNADVLDENHSKIIANPNCSTLQMLVALKPIHDAVEIERINVATYQAVSGSGMRGVDELKRQVRQWVANETLEVQSYPQQIAFNVIPQIDTFQENGYTREEMKMIWETQKILSPTIQVNPTTVRVPVFNGHAEAVHIETKTKITVAEVYSLLEKAPGVTVLSNENYPTPQTHGEGTDDVFVGRIREDLSHPFGLNLWIVADNIRKGAALNAVQIAELLLSKRFI